MPSVQPPAAPVEPAPDISELASHVDALTGSVAFALLGKLGPVTVADMIGMRDSIRPAVPAGLLLEVYYTDVVNIRIHNRRGELLLERRARA